MSIDKVVRIVSNNCGVDDWGLGVLLADGLIAKMTSSSWNSPMASASTTSAPPPPHP